MATDASIIQQIIGFPSEGTHLGGCITGYVLELICQELDILLAKDEFKDGIGTLFMLGVGNCVYETGMMLLIARRKKFRYLVITDMDFNEAHKNKDAREQVKKFLKQKTEESNIGKWLEDVVANVKMFGNSFEIIDLDRPSDFYVRIHDNFVLFFPNEYTQDDMYKISAKKETFLKTIENRQLVISCTQGVEIGINGWRSGLHPQSSAEDQKQSKMEHGQHSKEEPSVLKNPAGSKKINVDRKPSLEVPGEKTWYSEQHIRILLFDELGEQGVYIGLPFSFELFSEGDLKLSEATNLWNAVLALDKYKASVVPLNSGRNHWLIAMIQKFIWNDGKEYLAIRLCNSLGDYFEHQTGPLAKAIHMFDENKPLRFINSNGFKQIDKYNCGPLVVENAKLLASNELTEDNFKDGKEDLIKTEVPGFWSEKGKVTKEYSADIRSQQIKFLSSHIQAMMDAWYARQGGKSAAVSKPAKASSSSSSFSKETPPAAPLSPFRHGIQEENWKDVSPPSFSFKNVASAVIQGSIAMTRRKTFIFTCVSFFFVIGIIILIVELTRKNENEQKYTPPLLSSPAALSVEGNSQFAPSTFSNKNGTLLFCPSSLSDGASDIALNCFTVGGAAGVFDISVVVKNYSQASKVVLTDFAAIDYCVVSVNGARQVSFPTDDFDDISVGETVGAPLLLVKQSSQIGVGKAPQQDYSNTTVGFALGGFDPSRDNTVTFRLGVIGAGQIYFMITAK